MAYTSCLSYYRKSKSKSVSTHSLNQVKNPWDSLNSSPFLQTEYNQEKNLKNMKQIIFHSSTVSLLIILTTDFIKYKYKILLYIKLPCCCLVILYQTQTKQWLYPWPILVFWSQSIKYKPHITQNKTFFKNLAMLWKTIYINQKRLESTFMSEDWPSGPLSRIYNNPDYI